MADYDRKQIDDVKHALGQLLAFYDKELDERNWKFWWSVLKKLPYNSVMRAMAEYLGEGKYAPKPASIAEIAKRYTSSEPAHHDAHREPVKQANPEIETAWQWYIALCSKDTSIEMWQDKLEGVSEDMAERYIHIVNHEAKAAGQPDAINPEHKLKEIWG